MPTSKKFYDHRKMVKIAKWWSNQIYPSSPQNRNRARTLAIDKESISQNHIRFPAPDCNKTPHMAPRKTASVPLGPYCFRMALRLTRLPEAKSASQSILYISSDQSTSMHYVPWGAHTTRRAMTVRVCVSSSTRPRDKLASSEIRLISRVPRNWLHIGPMKAW